MARLLTLAAGLVLAAGIAAAAQPLPPALTAPVNDFAGVIDASSSEQIETLIRRLQETTGDAIVVATVTTFKPYADLQAYAVEMFENHGKGIGSRKGDSGALVVVAVDDRQVWIEVGYGLEEFITDGFAGEVSRDTMVPFFRQGRYGPGILAGVSRLVERVADGRNVEIAAAPVSAPARSRRGVIGAGPILALVLLVVFINLMTAGRSRRLRRRRYWASGVGPFGAGAAWGSRSSWGGRSGGFGGFGGFGGGRSGGGGGGASW
jgi:uncharacterized protein